MIKGEETKYLWAFTSFHKRLNKVFLDAVKSTHRFPFLHLLVQSNFTQLIGKVCWCEKVKSSQYRKGGDLVVRRIIKRMIELSHNSLFYEGRKRNRKSYDDVRVYPYSWCMVEMRVGVTLSS